MKIKIYCSNNGVTEVDFMKDVIIVDDMIDGVSSPYIKEWNVSGLTKPTDEQLESLKSEAELEIANNIIRETRKNLYGDIGDQLDEIYTDIDAWKARIKKIKDDNPKN